MRSLKLIVMLWVCSTPWTAQAQETDLLPSFSEAEAEALADRSDGEEAGLPDPITLVTPIYINSADREVLESLTLLTDVQISQLLFYREHYGPIRSPWELAAIPTFDANSARAVLQFAAIDDVREMPATFKQLWKDGRHEVILRYQQVTEQKKGFEPMDTSSEMHQGSRYLGKPQKYYARYRFSNPLGLSAGVTLEQDPGEPFRRPGGRIQPDYISGHLFIGNRGLLKSLVMGDFEVNMAQGLVMQQGYASGKTGAGGGMRRRSLPLKPHTAANETRFSRGAGVLLRPGKRSLWEIMAFGSYRKTDGNVIVADTTHPDAGAALAFTSLTSSGLHRTPSELEDRNRIALASSGGSVHYQGKVVRVGVNTAWHHFSIPWTPPARTDNTEAFSGTDVWNTSVDYRVLHRNFILYGESAVSWNGGFALLNGADLVLPGQVMLSMLHRYYSRDHQSIFHGAFGASSRAAGEHGFYLSLHCSPFRQAEWTSYIDFFRHPVLRYGVDGPSYGIDLSSQLSWRPRPDITVTARFRRQNGQVNDPMLTGPLDLPVENVKTGARLHVEFRPTASLSLRTRLEVASRRIGSAPSSTGLLFFQDIKYTFAELPLALYARFAVFETESYDSRIYAYEHDVLYQFSVPAYYGRGCRYYMMARIKAHRYLDLWLRWAQVIWTDRDVVGTGLEEINGRTRSELKVQVRLKF